MAIRQTICESLGGFLCVKYEISPQTQENISNWRSVAERRHISRDLTDTFVAYKSAQTFTDCLSYSHATIWKV